MEADQRGFSDSSGGPGTGRRRTQWKLVLGREIQNTPPDAGWSYSLRTALWHEPIAGHLRWMMVAILAGYGALFAWIVAPLLACPFSGPLRIVTGLAITAAGAGLGAFAGFRAAARMDLEAFFRLWRPRGAAGSAAWFAWTLLRGLGVWIRFGVVQIGDRIEHEIWRFVTAVFVLLVLCSLVGCGISALSGRWEVTGAVIVFGIIAILFWVLLWAPAIALTRPGIGLSFLLSTTLALVPLHSLMAAYGVPRSPFAKGVPPLDSAVLATLLAIVGAMLPLAHVIAHRWLRGPHSRVERVVAAWTDGATELSGVQEPDADPVDLGPLLPWRPRVDHLAVAGAIEEGGAAGSESARFLLDRLQSALDPQRPRASDGTRSSLVDVIPSPTPKSLSNWISVLQGDAPDAWPSRFVARFCLVLAEGASVRPIVEGAIDRDWKRRLLREIASRTRPLVPVFHRRVCQRCLVRFHVHALPLHKGRRFVGCRACLQSRVAFDCVRTTLVLGAGQGDGPRVEDGDLRVPWPLAPALDGSPDILPDFDALEIGNVPDGEVERLVILVRNDTDPIRQKRNRAAVCRIESGASLAPNTVGMLQGTFRIVEARDAG